MNPSSKTFGTVLVNGIRHAVFTVSNSGTQPLSVSAAAIDQADGSGFAVKSNGCANASVPPRHSCLIVITFKPTAAGPKSGVLQVSSNDPDTPVKLVSLSAVAR